MAACETQCQFQIIRLRVPFFHFYSLWSRLPKFLICDKTNAFSVWK
jgi:hypothetical protein